MYTTSELPSYHSSHHKLGSTKEYIKTHAHDQLQVLTYLRTYSMVQSPSWEANWFAASQQIPRISRNPKVQYRTH